MPISTREVSRERRQRTLAVLAAALAAFLAGGSVAAQTTGAIAGRVTDSASGLPLGSGSIQLLGADETNLQLVAVAGDGTFRIEGLTPATYYARTSGFAGHVQELFDNVPCPLWCPVSTGTPIVVAAGSTVSNINFALGVAGRIAGLVTDSATGLPLTEGHVRVVDSGGGIWRGDAVPDGTGHYTVDGLPSGVYSVRAQGFGDWVDELYPDVACPTSSCSPGLGAPVSVTAGATTGSINFTLDLGGAISGTVSDADTGVRLTAGRIEVWVPTSEASWSKVGSAAVDGAGAYRVGGIPAGTYYVRTTGFVGHYQEIYDAVPCPPTGFCTTAAATPVPVARGVSTAGIDFALSPGASLGGTVTNSSTGAPLPGGTIQLYCTDSSQCGSTTTDAGGAYEIAGLPPGDYYVRTRDFTGYVDGLYSDLTCAGSCDVTRGTPVHVERSAAVSNVDFSLALGGTISGVVTEDGAGLPLTGGYVVASDAAYNSFSATVTDASGRYVIQGIPSGTYHVIARNFAGHVSEAWQNVPCPGGGCPSGTGLAVSVSVGNPVSGIDFSLSRGGAISGLLTDAQTGRPLPTHFVVDAYDATGKGTGQGAWHWDSPGTFLVDGLPAGDYYLLAWAGSAYVQTLYNGIPCPSGCTPTTGTPVHVTVGQTTTIQMALVPAGGISGVVTDSVSAAAVSGARVDAYSQSGAFVKYGWVTASGAYSIQGLAPGTYFVRINSAATHVAELYDNIPCGDLSCSVTSGKPVVVAAGVTTAHIDFALDQGRIAATVRDAVSSAGLAKGRVAAYHGESLAGECWTDAAGTCTISGLAGGSYHVRTWAFSGHVQGLYDGIQCPGDCDLGSGTLVRLQSGTPVAIAFALARGGAVAGHVRDVSGGAALTGGSVWLYDASGRWAGAAAVDALGAYTVGGLTAGSYYALTRDFVGYGQKLYANLACEVGCSPTSGTSISVSGTGTMSNIDFALDRQRRSWATTGSMTEPRASHSGTLLPDGRVLVVAGNRIPGLVHASAELYDPATGLWRAAAQVLGYAAGSHTATVLPTGKVLVVFGGAAELYDPARDEWQWAQGPPFAGSSQTATLLPDGKVLLVGGYSNAAPLASAAVYDPATGNWQTVGSLSQARYWHAAVLLADGRVLVAGGNASAGLNDRRSSVEIFDPVSSTWSLQPTGMNVARSGCSANLLPDGRVLVIGGAAFPPSAEVFNPGTGSWTLTAAPPSGSAVYGSDGLAVLLPDGRVLWVGFSDGDPQVYDPQTGQWTASGSPLTRRNGATVTVLPDGRVLVAGGYADHLGTVMLSSTEIFDPLSPERTSWTPGGTLAASRSDHTTSVLPDGRLLVVGGRNASGPVLTAEYYDPATGTRSAAPAPAAGHCSHTATHLPDGRILIAGGECGPGDVAEIFDPATQSWPTAAKLLEPSAHHAAVLLSDGTVVLYGGVWGGTWPDAARVYDAARDAWRRVGFAQGTEDLSATPLPDGRVLMVGGSSLSHSRAEAQLFDSRTREWTDVPAPRIDRTQHTATLLPSGQVLVLGGKSGVAQAEIFDPAALTWRDAGALLVPRYGHTATLLPSGRILVAGGFGPDGTSLSSVELYDPLLQASQPLPHLATARAAHTATLSATGRVFLVGGRDTGAGIDTIESLDPVGAVASRRPLLTSVSPSPLRFGTPMNVAGSRFGGHAEASGGMPGTSAVNFPVIRLRSLETERTTTVVWDPRSTLSDASTTLAISPPPTGTGLPDTLETGRYYLTVVRAGVSSDAKVVGVACETAILEAPQSQVVKLGEPAIFEVEAAGAWSYQWQRDAVGDGMWRNIPGAVEAKYTTPPVAAADAGALYRVLVKGRCGTVTSSAAALGVRDTASPVAAVEYPRGGEYWLLSEAGHPENQELVTWSMSDDIRICRVEVSLVFSTDGGSSWSGASAGGGLPAAFGAGGACPYPGESTTSLTYVVPIDFPAGVPGALYKVHVRVVDEAGNEGVAESARPFFFVRANPDSVRTLIIKNTDRMQDAPVMGGGVISAAAAAALDVKLQELANHPRVLGFVVDVGNILSVEALYAAWDADPGNPSKANAVLFGCHGTPAPASCGGVERDGIHDTVRTLLRAYTGVKHLVLAGDDRVIPFGRVTDRTVLLGEDAYANGSGVTATGTRVGMALAGKKYLTDDALTMKDMVRVEDLESQYFVPELGVGRLVETPEEITTAIATYIAQDGVLDLSAMDAATGHKVLVTGYDFLSDGARAVRSRWKSALGVTTGDSSLEPVDGALIGGAWGLGSVSEQETALRDHLSGNGAQRYGVMALLGHATHYEEGVPGSGTDPHVVQGLPAVEMAGGDRCVPPTPSGAGVGLSGGVVLAVGCHGGLTVPGSCSTDAEHSQDLPQSFLRRGVQAYVANTGYGWGLKHGIGYGERLLQIATEELGSGGTVEVGEAVRRTKLRYYLETPRFDAYDEKSLMQWTLFGLPMYAVKTGITAGTGDESPGGSELFRGEQRSVSEREETERIGKVTVRRSAGRPPAMATAVQLPSYLTQVNLHFDLTAPGVYVKRDAEGNDVTGATGCPLTLPGGVAANAGCYYTLNGLVERASGAGDLPVQPYLVYDSRLSGTSQHGVLWLGGEYEEGWGWRPVIGELVSNGGDGSEHGPSPRGSSITPIAPRVTVGADPGECRASDLEVNSLLVAAGEALKEEAEDPVFTIERHFRTIDVEAMYFNDTSQTLNNCDREGPVLGAGPYHSVAGSLVSFAVPASDASGVWRVMVVWNDNLRDGQGRGRWRPLELVQDGTSGVWRGSVRVAGSPRMTYVVETVDVRGNVRWLEWTSAELPSSGVPLGIPEPTDVEVTPEVAPTIVDFSPHAGPVGTTVTVVGTGFTGATEVTFAGVATSFNVVTPTLLTALVPLGAGAGPIGVTTPVGSATSTQVFTPTLPLVADVGIGKTGPLRVAPGAPVSWVITVANGGPDGVSGLGVTDEAPGDVTGLSWSCSSSVGSTCTASGVGSLLDTGSVAVGGQLTYKVSGTVSSSTTASALVNTATLTLPAGVLDPTPTDHVASWTTAVSTGESFYTLAPCRLVDTRSGDGPILAGGQDRTFTLAGHCGVPSGAKAVALNVTVTGATALGNVRLWAAGTAMPTTSVVNFGPGQTRANNAILELGTSGALNARLGSTGQAHLVVDVSGYFQ